MRRRALFLDRDGVINIDHGYVCAQEKFEFVDGIFELGRCASQLGFLNIVVTNQAGIGRGYYSEEDFLALSDWMCGVLCERGAPIAKVYHCPFHSRHGVGVYKRESADRKTGSRHGPASASRVRPGSRAFGVGRRSGDRYSGWTCGGGSLQFALSRGAGARQGDDSGNIPR